MRIIHVDTERGWRGGQNQVYLLHQGLCAAGLDSTVICRSGEALHRRLADEGLPVMPVPKGPLYAAQVAHVVHRLTNPTTIIHAHASAAHGSALLGCLGTRSPLVVTRRVDFPLKPNPIGRFKYGTRVTTFVAISQAIANILITGGVSPQQIEIIPSGVPLPTPQSQAKADLHAEFSIPADHAIAICPAALVAHKGHRYLIEAWKKVSVPSTVLCCGAGDLRADLERQAVGHSNIRFLGYRGDLPRLLAHADFAVLASIEEGLGSVLADCQLHGLPVISTTAGGIPEIVAHERSGLLCPPGDAAALAQAITRLLSDPACRERLSHGALEQGRRFLSSAMVNAYIQLYPTVIAKWRGS